MSEQILTHTQIEYRIKRIAYQIYEVNIHEEEIVIAGVLENGYEFSKKIKSVLEALSTLKVTLCSVEIDRNNVFDIKTSLTEDQYKNKSLVLVDDVLNSGKTLIYCVKHFLNVPLKQLKTVVLVNRNHKQYPIKADFKGMSLSTSLKEHVTVSFGKEYAVYLQ